MKLALIPPLCAVEHRAFLPGRFCIGSIAARYPRYKHAFEKDSDAGYEVTLDNGVFEGQEMEDAALVQLAHDIKARVLVVPDSISASWQFNYDRALRFKDNYGKDLQKINCELMYVPQCLRSEGQAISVSEHIASFAASDFPFKWIGICRDFAYNVVGKYTHTQDQELNRYFFVSWMQTTATNFFEVAHKNGRKWHFLGIGDHIHLLQYYWMVDSMDTASFWWHGYCGHTVHNGTLSGFKRPHDYFERAYPLDEAVEENIETICYQAQAYGHKAESLRREKLGHLPRV